MCSTSNTPLHAVTVLLIMINISEELKIEARLSRTTSQRQLLRAINIHAQADSMRDSSG